MAISALLSFSQWDRQEELNKQLDACPTVTGKQRRFIEKFLLQEGIFDLSEVSEQVMQRYRMYVCNTDLLSNGQRQTYLNSLEPFIMYHLMDGYPEICEKIVNNQDLNRAIRNKIGTFLMSNGIHAVDEIDYEVREHFEQYLTATIAERKVSEYVKSLDKLKIETIRHDKEVKPFVQQELRYVGKKLFLSYHPDYDIAMSLYYWQDKSQLVYDLPAAASEKIRQQMIDILNWVFREQTNLKVRHDLYLMPLHRFFQYCVDTGIEDIEIMEARDIIGYRESVTGQVGTKETEYYQIVNMIQRFLFCNNEKPRWKANSWYLERFGFKYDRMNPARPVSRLSFWQICDLDNRNLFKGYIQYELGLTNMAIENIRSQYYGVRDFLIFCDDMGFKVGNMSKSIMDTYADYLDLRDNLPHTFNKNIISVFRFWNYLSVVKKAEKAHITSAYYLKKGRNKHHDLSVPKQTVTKVITALADAPEHLRLMYLNLWATGCRINEICTIKANAYKREGERTFMLVNQYKMKREKLIPIPMELYVAMTEYIGRVEKKGEEFVFTKRDGIRAYDPGNFSKQIKKILDKAGISKEEYNFRAHGYRHGVGTRFYDSGVAIQAIRDYLGHRTEEMTKQYIDYNGKRVRDASYEYFENIGRKDVTDRHDNKDSGS
ncbi:MAG: site-specific integrase [Lachnospiraceae bacterium]|nr:site-specific integrase [Lachnospiraceae bacterium]